MLLSVIPASLSSSGKAGRNTVRARTCLNGKRDVRSHEPEPDPGSSATTL